MTLIAIAFIFACFFAMNIGASGTAAAMGATYGAGAIKSRRIAVVLVGVVALLGAVTGGGEVAKTISSGIIPEERITVVITILIIASASLTLFVSNRMGIPLSTSEVTVGALVGVGIVFQQINMVKLLSIVAVWFILPFLAYWIAKGLGKIIKYAERSFLSPYQEKNWFKKCCIGFLIFFGCYEAFAAGMNNVANAIGPLIAAGLISPGSGLWMGAIFMCLGAILLGGPVLETNGKKITHLSLLQGSAVSFTSGSLVIVASLFGIPVPLTQATTMSIIGVGSNQGKQKIWRLPVVKRIILVWVLSPIVAMIASSSLYYLFIQYNPLPLMIMLISLILIEAKRWKTKTSIT